MIESEEHCLEMAGQLAEITHRLQIPFIFKASFDKANRTSIRSYRGPGLEKGLEILGRVRSELELPVLSDVHEEQQIGQAREVLDILQIPAFLCRQTDLLVAAARSGRVVNVKKGQFLAPWDARNIVDKIRSAGGDRILLTERGSSFGYNNLVVDFKSIPILRSLGALAVFDATHSVQLPGGTGTATGGQAEFIPTLARAALATRIDGLFIEVHDNPEEALSDGPNALQIDLLSELLETLQRIDRVVKNSSPSP